MEEVRAIGNKLVEDGKLSREQADDQIAQFELEQGGDDLNKKPGDLGRLFLMSLLKKKLLTITITMEYSDKMNLLSAAAKQPIHSTQVAQGPVTPPQSRSNANLQQKPQKRRSAIGTLFRSRSRATTKPIPAVDPEEECPVAELSQTCPVTPPQPPRKHEPVTKSLSRFHTLERQEESQQGEEGEEAARKRLGSQLPSDYFSFERIQERKTAMGAESKVNFKVQDLKDTDGGSRAERKFIQFDPQHSMLRFIARRGKQKDIPFHTIKHWDCENGQIIITTDPEKFQLVLEEKSEEQEVRHYLEMLGHQEWTEEEVVISGVLDKKGPYVLNVKRRFVKVTPGKLSYYKENDSKPLNTIILRSDLNEIKRVDNTGFSIATKVKDDNKDFTFHIPRQAEKNQGAERERWIAAVESAYNKDFNSVQISQHMRKISSSGRHVPGSGNPLTPLGNLARGKLEQISTLMKDYVEDDNVSDHITYLLKIISDMEAAGLRAASNSHSLGGGMQQSGYLPPLPVSQPPPLDTTSLTSSTGSTSSKSNLNEDDQVSLQSSSGGVISSSKPPPFVEQSYHTSSAAAAPMPPPRTDSCSSTVRRGTLQNRRDEAPAPPPVPEKRSSISGPRQRSNATCPRAGTVTRRPLPSTGSSDGSVILECTPPQRGEEGKEEVCMEFESEEPLPPPPSPSPPPPPPPPPIRTTSLSSTAPPPDTVPRTPDVTPTPASPEKTKPVDPVVVEEKESPPPPLPDHTIPRPPPVIPATPPDPVYEQTEPIPSPQKPTPAPVVPIPEPPKPAANIPKPPPAPVLRPPGAPAPPRGIPLPPGVRAVVNNKNTNIPKVVPGIKVNGLFWSKVPPIPYKKSVWTKMEDKSPMIDVSQMERFFAAKESHAIQTQRVVKEPEGPKLDAKRSQNIGIFLYGASVDPKTISHFVSKVSSDNVQEDSKLKEHIPSLKKLAPTYDDVIEFQKVPESAVEGLDRARQTMWYMVQCPWFTQRVHMIDVTTTLPEDFEEVKGMCTDVQDASNCLLNNGAFLKFLEVVLTVGNMMNASVNAKKTSHSFKLTQTLPLLSDVRSQQDRGFTLLDFIVLECVRVSGEVDCLSFVKEFEVLHSAAQASSIVSMGVEVDVMQKDLVKLMQRTNEIGAQQHPDKEKAAELGNFLNEVKNFVNFFQVDISSLSDATKKLKTSFSTVLERYGESPNTDSEDFFKTLSDFHTTLKDVIKKCSLDLPECVAYLRPVVHSTIRKANPIMGAKSAELMNSLKGSAMFQKQNTFPVPDSSPEDQSWIT